MESRRCLPRYRLLATVTGVALATACLGAGMPVADGAPAAVRGAVRVDARFLDDVRAWPSAEPAIDFTSTGMLALAPAGGG
jgi:hypothetical protein